MRILVAPLELKGTLDAGDAAQAIADGLRAAHPGVELELLPLADGGPGTLAAIGRARKTASVEITHVRGADGKPIAARWLRHGEHAIIESAEAVGLTRFPAKTPMAFTSHGVGELIRAALDKGARDIAVGIGGSATVDLGLGAAQALGVRYFDSEARLVTDPVPRSFPRIMMIDRAGRDPRLDEVELSAWLDVQAPLLGPDGFVYRYGGQKGVEAAQMPELEGQAGRLTRGGIASRAGDGAGGGLGWALRVLCNATQVSGFAAVAEAVDLDGALERCSLVITAEGRLDAQSTQGKGTWALAQRARAIGRPVILMTGASRLSPELWRTAFTDVVTVGTRMPTDRDDAYQQLVTTARACSLRGPWLAP